MRSESAAHGHCLVGFVFKCATRGTRCSSAGGYQTALHYCGLPLLDWGELPVFVVRPHAPNRDACTVTVWYEYMYRSTPTYIHTYIYTYVYIYSIYILWREEQTTDTVGVASGLGEAFIQQK